MYNLKGKWARKKILASPQKRIIKTLHIPYIVIMEEIEKLGVVILPKLLCQFICLQ